MRVVTFNDGQAVRVATFDKATRADFEGSASARDLVLRDASGAILATYPRDMVIKCIEPRNKDAQRVAHRQEIDSLRDALKDEAQAHAVTRAALEQAGSERAALLLTIASLTAQRDEARQERDDARASWRAASDKLICVRAALDK